MDKSTDYGGHVDNPFISVSWPRVTMIIIIILKILIIQHIYMHMLIMLMNTQSKYRYSTQKVRVVVVLSSWELWLQSEQRRGMWMSEVKEDDLTSPDRCWRERSQYN